MPRTLPSRERLLALFIYDPLSGDLKRIASKRKLAATHHGRYLGAWVNEDTYLAHRVIWKMMTGKDAGTIDHIDGNGLNNKWDNLREATHAENIRNAKLSIANKSGYKGVSYDRANHSWRASITVNRRALNLGRYASIEEAVAVRAAAAERFHGEFARS